MGKLRRILNRKTLSLFFLGFSSGLPIFLTWSTLQAWMTEAHVDLKVIGLFSLVGLPYTLKFLWAPLVDRFVPGKLGRRKGWALITQVACIMAIINLGLCHPEISAKWVAIAALILAICSATQDIVLDAWRREILPDEELGWGTSVFVNGYIVSMRYIAGALALILSDKQTGFKLEWSQTYFIMAGFMLLGIVGTLMTPEPKVQAQASRKLRDSFLLPLQDFFRQRGITSASTILLFILLYKLGDNMALSMTIPFYLKIGFTKTQIAAITKVFGAFANQGGMLLGGLVILRLGIFRSLWWFGILQAVAVSSLALLSVSGPSLQMLTVTIALENIAFAMGTIAFSAYMASITNKKFSATQFALLTSLMGLPRTLMSAPTGWLAESLGFTGFFIMCTLIAVPGILMIPRLRKIPHVQ